MKTKIYYLTSILCFFVLISANVAGSNLTANQLDDEKEKVKKEFLAVWEFFNSTDFTDSLNFKKYLENYADDYVSFSKEGEPPVTGKQSLMWIGGLLKKYKPKFDVTVDKIEVSGDLAVVFYHYHEFFTSRETGDVAVDTHHSAMSVLRRDEGGKWENVFNKWGLGK